MLTQLTPQSTLTEVNLGSYLLGAASITEIPSCAWVSAHWFFGIQRPGLFLLTLTLHGQISSCPAWPCLYWIRVTHLWPEPHEFLLFALDSIFMSFLLSLQSLHVASLLYSSMV